MLNNYYRPQQSCGQGNIFSSVCQEFCSRRGVYPIACWDIPPRPGAETPLVRHPPLVRHLPGQTPSRTRSRPPRSDTPLWSDTPWSDTPPDQEQTPLVRHHLPLVRHHGPRPGAEGYCCSRYASYWNAFLSSPFFHMLTNAPITRFLSP